jgi:hypothetical protein
LGKSKREIIPVLINQPTLNYLYFMTIPFLFSFFLG